MSHIAYKKWSPDELRRLRAMHEAGKTNAEMGAVLGRSAGACAIKLHDLGVTKDPINAAGGKGAVEKARAAAARPAGEGFLPSWQGGGALRPASEPGAGRRYLSTLLGINERRYRQASSGKGPWAKYEDEGDLWRDLDHLRGCVAAVRAMLQPERAEKQPAEAPAE